MCVHTYRSSYQSGTRHRERCMNATGARGTAVVIGVGAERGLGAALCRRFAAEAYHVLVGGRTSDKIEQVVRTIVSAGGSAEPVGVDATSEQDIARLFDRAMRPGPDRAPAD